MPSPPGEFQFTCVQYGVPRPARDVRLAFPPIGDDEIIKLAHLLRPRVAEGVPDIPPEVLAKAGSTGVVAGPPAYAEVAFPGYPPLHARIDRFGQTAAMVRWVHNPKTLSTGERVGETQAVSLYLTGLDRNADTCLLSAAEQLQFTDRKGLPVEKQVWVKLRNEERPLAVQIFLQPLARLDPSVRAGFLALGAAFFGTLGVANENETRTDD